MYTMAHIGIQSLGQRRLGQYLYVIYSLLQLLWQPRPAITQPLEAGLGEVGASWEVKV